MTEKQKDIFAHRLRCLRLAAGISLYELACRAGLNESFVGKLERGERRPSLETARKLAAALGQDINCWESSR